MSSARYVGRVGALAVALGIGAVIAGVPGVAWADTEGEPDPSDAPGVSEPKNPDGSAGDVSDTDVGGGDLGDSGDGDGVGDAGDPGDVDGADDSAGGMQVGISGGPITSTTPGSAGAKSKKDDDADPPKKRSTVKQKVFSLAPSPTKTTPQSTAPTVAEPGRKARSQAPSLSIASPKDPGPQIKQSTSSPVDVVPVTLAAPGLQKPVTARMTAMTKPLAQSPVSGLLPFVTLAPTADGKLPGSSESPLLLGFMAAGREVDRKGSVEDETLARTVGSTETSLMMTSSVKATAAPSNLDVTPPTVSLTAPFNNASVSGTVTLTANASDNVKVTGVQFYVDGTPLGAEDTRSPYSASWNTTTVANGPHTLTARARDAAGNITTSTMTVTVDNTKPTVSLAAPTNGAPVSGTVTLTATASDNVAVTGVKFYVDNIQIGSTDTTSPYSASWDTKLVTNGTHTLKAEASDAAGNITTSTRTVTVDNTKPTVSLTSPASGATVSGPMTLTATASDNVAVTGVKFYVDNIQIGSTDTTSPYSASWDTKLVTNGTHTLKAEASDAAGNTNTSTRTVTVANPDITAPTVSLTAPAGDVTVSGPITLSATATDNVGVAGVQFKLDEVNLGAEDTTPDANGYSVVWDTATVSNGSYRLTAVARDAAGNITTTSTRTVIVANPDTVAPTVNLTAPADLAGVTGTVTLSATATDNVGVAGVQFLVNGTPLGAEDTTPDPDGGYSVVWDTATVADGTYTLTAQARDTAGNTGTSTVTVAVVTPDTVAPTLSLTAPANGATLSGTVTLSATATDNVGVREVQFIVDGAPILTDSSSPYSAVWNTHLVSNGTHTLTARAHDAAGNMTYSTVTITVDNINSAPVASPTLFSQDPLTGAVTGWVNATDSDGNVLSYTVTAAPAGGTVWVNPKTGSYAYIPSQVARLAADQTAGPDTDTFTVTVSDGKDSTSTVVTVPLSPATLTTSQTTTPVGSGAAGIAFRGNYALVANQGADTLTVIDTTTGAVIATLPVGDAPTSVATTYNGTFAFVTNQGSNTVSVINTYDNTVYKTIGVGAQPWGIVQATSSTEVVPGTWSRAVYVTNSGSNTVSVIETLNYTVAATIPVGSTPTGVAVSPDGTRVYVTNKASNTVSVIDTASKAVDATVPVGTNPVGVAVNANGTRVYVTNLNGTVSVINTAMPTPTVVATVPVGPQPYSVALSPDSRLAYVANSNDTISVIDTVTNTVLRTVTMDAAPESGMHFLALDPYGRVYTTDAFDAVVRSLSVSPSASTELPITSTAITVGSNPTVTAVNGSHAYVLNQGSHTISVIDTVTKQVVKTIPVSASAYDMVVAPNDQRIYVANGDTVSVIDTATGNEVVPPISIPNLCADGSCWGSAGGLYDLAISPDGSRVYALRGYATMGGNFSAVSLIDTATNSVITTNVTDWLYDIEAAGNGTLLYGAYGESYFATRPFVTVFDAVTLGGFAYIPVSTAEAVGTEYATGEYAAAVATSPDGKRAYAIVTSKYVAVIDTDPGSATYNTQIGQIAVPFGVQSVAVSPDNRRLYISLSDGKTVEVVDTTTNAVLGYFTKPSSGAMTVGPDGTLYLIDNANGKVYAVTVGSTTVL